MIHLTTRVHLFTSPRNICSLRQTVLHKAQRRILQKARTFHTCHSSLRCPRIIHGTLCPSETTPFTKSTGQILGPPSHQPWSLLLKQINLSLMSLHFRVSKQLVSPWEAGNLRAAIQNGGLVCMLFPPGFPFCRRQGTCPVPPPFVYWSKVGSCQ